VAAVPGREYATLRQINVPGLICYLLIRNFIEELVASERQRRLWLSPNRSIQLGPVPGRKYAICGTNLVPLYPNAPPK
jgi:hypothetical protein